MQHNSSRRRSIVLDEDYFDDKRYRIEVLSQDALNEFEDLLDELDNTPLPRTLHQFWSLGTRLQIVGKALLAVSKEAGPGAASSTRARRFEVAA